MFRITLIEAYSNKNIPEDKKGLYRGISITNRHFEITKDGIIIEGEYYKSMMSDQNLLNDKIGETNTLYSDLLDLEDTLTKTGI